MLPSTCCPKEIFSQPRKYKNLKERIGIMYRFGEYPMSYPSIFDETGKCGEDPFYLFIFKKENEEWKIEKIVDIGSWSSPKRVDYRELEEIEKSIIKDLKNKK